MVGLFIAILQRWWYRRKKSIQHNERDEGTDQNAGAVVFAVYRESGHAKRCGGGEGDG